MSTRTSTVYKYVKEHYPISKEHQVENPWSTATRAAACHFHRWDGCFEPRTVLHTAPSLRVLNPVAHFGSCLSGSLGLG